NPQIRAARAGQLSRLPAPARRGPHHRRRRDALDPLIEKSLSSLATNALNAAMFFTRWTFDDHPPHAEMPVRTIRVGRADETVAVHVGGDLARPVPPLVCLGGYVRNMLDFRMFVSL